MILILNHIWFIVNETPSPIEEFFALIHTQHSNRIHSLKLWFALVQSVNQVILKWNLQLCLILYYYLLQMVILEKSCSGHQKCVPSLWIEHRTFRSSVWRSPNWATKAVRDEVLSKYKKPYVEEILKSLIAKISINPKRNVFVARN